MGNAKPLTAMSCHVSHFTVRHSLGSGAQKLFTLDRDMIRTRGFETHRRATKHGAVRGSAARERPSQRVTRRRDSSGTVSAAGGIAQRGRNTAQACAWRPRRRGAESGGA
jgi:hypothetical protein